MYKAIGISLLAISISGHAEVYKCPGGVYQSTPCTGGAEMRIQNSPAPPVQPNQGLRLSEQKMLKQIEADRIKESEERQGQALERIRQVQEDSRKHREKEPEFAKRECFLARQREADLLKKKEKDPGEAYFLNVEIEIARQQQQVLCD